MAHRKKKGAHKEDFIRTLSSTGDLESMYGPCLYRNARIVTLAPEQDPQGEVVAALARRGICVSLGHSEATLTQGETAVQRGATLITHLFNAMTSFHHRYI